MEDRSHIRRIPVMLTDREIQVLIRSAEFTETAFEDIARESGRDVRQSVLRTAHSVLLVALDRAAMRDEVAASSSPAAGPVRLPRAHRPVGEDVH